MTSIHPVLPTGVDALRILDVQPGEFLSPLVGTLASMAFRDKPKYMALSYTWGSSHPKDPELPPSILGGSGPYNIRINEYEFNIGQNLYLALQHLRSKKHTLSIWIDAICINQADNIERGQQVSLMAFIYRRATKVVAWLGIEKYPDQSIDDIEDIKLWYSKLVTARTMEQSQVLLFGDSRSQGSSKVDDCRDTFRRVINSKYWTRLWIVQEVCLPRLLVFMCGNCIWSYDDFRQWLLEASAQPGALDEVPLLQSEAASRLLDTRATRHSEMMSLETLIERFGNSECAELRDRIYGMLGCANDIRAVAVHDDRAALLDAHITSLRSGSRRPPTIQRNSGALEIDYSCSLYNIWAKIVGFAYFQARSSERNMAAQGTYSHNLAGHEYLEDELEPLSERAVSIVKIAGVIQNALDQKVEEELANQCQTSFEYEKPIIIAVGYVAGEIVELGPDYSSLVGSSSEVQDWTDCWARYYKKDEEMETLRQLGEEYEATILDYNHQDLARIHALDHPLIVAWRVSNGYGGSEPMRKYHVESLFAHNTADNYREPRICLATGYVMGLVPPAAQVGDVLIRFWGCDAAVVMRPIESVQDPYFILVGRADLASSIAREKAMHASRSNSGKITLWESEWNLPGAMKYSQLPGAVHIKLDLRTLQKITANTKLYNHWTPSEREKH